MTRAQVMAPAIELAEKGFILTQGDVTILHAGQRKLRRPNLSKIFLKKDGSAYQAGDLLVQKELATTLRKISQKGVSAFYEGEIAEDIVKASQKEGGILSLEDFRQYKIRQERPLTCSYRGYEILTAPPPGGGLPLCQMLNILEGYPLRQTGYRTPQSLHWLLSAMFYGYRDRNLYLGDPDFVKIPQAHLLSKQYAAKLRQSIPNYSAVDHLTNAAPIEGNTTHYSVVDRQGNAVAVTYTLNSYFGAGVMAENTGFILNNEMDDFTTNLGQSNQFGLHQGRANLVEPGKIPLSSMSPTIVRKNGQLLLVTGSPGGSTIITTVLQILTNIIDYDLRLDRAVYAPRLHYQGEPNYVLTEKNGLSDHLKSALESRGYHFSNRLANWGAAETILRNQQGILEGVNDYRRPAGAALADSRNK
jgi:gamma-glutamyltranspeptidase/glutathione hydrolase